MASCKPPPKDEKGVWLRNKLEAVAGLLCRLGMKATDALPGILRANISWLLTRVKEVVVWMVQNLWILVIIAKGLAYKHCQGIGLCVHGDQSKETVMKCIILHDSNHCSTLLTAIILKVINANSLSCCVLLGV